jgi:large subunit ribosomal protein L1
VEDAMAKKTEAPAAETADAKPEKPKKPKKEAAAAEPVAAAPVEAPAAEATAAAAPAAAPADSGAKKKGRAGYPPRRGKKLRNLLKQQTEKLAKEGTVTVARAVSLLKSMKRSKFDETVEIHMHLGIDATQSDQLVRGTVSLPHGIGKQVRVIVFCQGENIAKAKAAGADHAGAEELIDKIQKEGWTEFDVALATQDLMGKVSRLGKVLGPRGLMPTPKAGTVIPMTTDVAQSVKEFKAGKVEYRSDKSGCVHSRVGKMSFEEKSLVENVQVFLEQIKAVRPASIKGHYILSASLSATQSPGIRIVV